DPISGDHRKRHTSDRAPVSSGVIDGAAVPIQGSGLAEIGEPEPAMAVENNVVRPTQRHAIAVPVEDRDIPGSEIHLFDTTTAVVLGLQQRSPPPILFEVPVEAAVV